MKEQDVTLSVIRALPIASFAVDSQQRILYLNDPAEKITGLVEGRVVGRCCFDTFRCRDSVGHVFCTFKCELYRRARQGNLPTIEVNLTGGGKKGARWFEVTPMTLRNEKGGPVIVHFLRDINRLKSFESFYRKSVSLIIPMAHPGRPGHPGVFSPLTDRELDVMKLLASGTKTREIAKKLYISPHTVRHHVRSLFSKLRARNRIELALLAAKNNLSSSPN
jgi:PAS domain S-box-containing protein